jgi:hypothetical protein
LRVFVASLREALKKTPSLFLESGRMRFCETPCGAEAALCRDSLGIAEEGDLSSAERLANLDATYAKGKGKNFFTGSLRSFFRGSLI